MKNMSGIFWRNAEAGRLFRMGNTNYHTHTVFCDGKDTPEEIVLYAISNGFSHLGFSGHMDADIHMDLSSYMKEITRLQKKYSQVIDILMGIELDTLYDASLAEKAEYVIGSTHFLDVPSDEPLSIDNTPEQLRFLCREFFGGDYYRLSKSYFELESRVCDRFRCTFIGHFDLITRFNDELHFLDVDDPRFLGPAMETMEYLVSRGIPFEINCGAVNRGRKKDFYPCRPLLKALHDFGGEILISSDAHQKELLNGCFHEAAQAAQSCGFTHANILEHDERGKIVTRSVPLDAY